jgi:Na+-translocating ferredoxin:NAD+ oxidoreductase RnfD subunit
LRPRAFTIILIVVFLALLITGIRFGDLGENLFNGGML